MFGNIKNNTFTLISVLHKPSLISYYLNPALHQHNLSLAGEITHAKLYVWFATTVPAARVSAGTTLEGRGGTQRDSLGVLLTPAAHKNR